jgi:hypothetical protein
MAQVTAIVTKIVMDEDYHVSFYNQFGYVAQVLETDVFIEISGDYLVCGSNGDSIRFFANTVTSIEGPTFSQSYTPITAGFFQQGSQYFERLSEIYDYIKNNIVSVVVRNTTAVMFKDGTRFTSANVTAIVNWGDIEGVLSNQEDLQDALDLKVDENAPILGSTKTKITYDSKGLVTSGQDAGISDITGLQDALDTKVPYTGATADVDLGVYKLSADAVEFSLTPTNAPGAGQVAYDGATGSLSYLMNSSDVICHIGQQLFAYVKNAEAVTITKGQPVYLYQASGNKATIKLAYNTSDAGSAKTLGLAAEDITSNHSGFVICQGVLSGINTGSYNEGDTLYLGAAAGTLTATKPYAPNHLVYIGVVERANNGAGQIYVKPQNGYELDEIHNVDAKNPNDKDGIFYNTSNSLWEHKSISDVLGYTPGQGTVTSVAALTLGTTGTDLSSSVATGTTTPVITLNVPTASASNRGALSSSDWSKFDGKQNAITLTTTGTSGAATLIGDTLNIPQYSGGSSGSDQVLTFQIASTINASATTYLNTGVTTTTIENAATMIAPIAFTLSNMYTVHYTATQPASGAQVLTVRKNGVDTALSITIAAGSAPTTTPYSDLTNSVSFAVGDRMTIKRQNLATATGGAVSGISLKLTI